ncbi:MAG: transglycosylase SLT domain-containing protein [Endomicrobiales bacterium]|nr:transglycosylase SLT domain-containing protein [Endomicrobiales bacterium]
MVIKRIFILLLGMSMSVGIYSDVGKINASKVSNEFFAKMAQQSVKYSNEKTVRKAQKLFKKARKSYIGGNKRKAKEYYSKALGVLSSVDIDLAMSEGFAQDYKKIFEDMNKLLRSRKENAGAKKYTIPVDLDNELVKKYLKIYTTGDAKNRIARALRRSGKYREMILGILEEYDLPEELVNLPIIESLYYNNGRSCAGAVGLWQIMHHRARALGLKVNFWVDERKDPEKATRAAAQYLRDLYIMFEDWHLALSAYNRGECGLARDLKFARATKMHEMSKQNATPDETEQFVPKFIAATIIADNYKEYGFKVKFDKPEEYDEITVNESIDLKIAAKCANTTVEKLEELNPSIKTWCTPPGYKDFKLRLPYKSKDTFEKQIAKVENLNPSSGYVKYRVQRGDCLSKIAKKFSTTVSSIKKDNKLEKGSFLKVNQILVLKPGREYFKNDN